MVFCLRVCEFADPVLRHSKAMHRPPNALFKSPVKVHMKTDHFLKTKNEAIFCEFLHLCHLSKGSGESEVNAVCEESQGRAYGG